eukprot:jgi/Pico_ML_1/54311/g4678.t1
MASEATAAPTTTPDDTSTIVVFMALFESSADKGTMAAPTPQSCNTFNRTSSRMGRIHAQR